MPEAQEILEKHLSRLLDARAFPKTICPSEVVRALQPDELAACGASSWRDLMPDIRDIAMQWRDQGTVEIMQKGEVLDDAALSNLSGPIRLRKVVD